MFFPWNLNNFYQDDQDLLDSQISGDFVRHIAEIFTRQVSKSQNPFNLGVRLNIDNFM